MKVNNYVNAAFEDCIESEFNPDIVQLALIDCYDFSKKKGFELGCLVTHAVWLSCIAGLSCALLYSKKKKPVKKDEVNQE